MIKSLAHKAEAFNNYCDVVNMETVGTSIQEACFDIQIQFVDFFTAAIKSIHGDDEGPLYRPRLPSPLNQSSS